MNGGELVRPQDLMCYLTALYFTVSCITSVGFGNVSVTTCLNFECSYFKQILVVLSKSRFTFRSHFAGKYAFRKDIREHPYALRRCVLKSELMCMILSCNLNIVFVNPAMCCTLFTTYQYEVRTFGLGVGGVGIQYIYYLNQLYSYRPLYCTLRV